jgi:hypothetical protein
MEEKKEGWWLGHRWSTTLKEAFHRRMTGMHVSIPSFADCKLADMIRAQPALGKVGLLYSLCNESVPTPNLFISATRPLRIINAI